MGMERAEKWFERENKAMHRLQTTETGVQRVIKKKAKDSKPRSKASCD